MTEFDFDELDKAVNDLMSGVDTSKRNTSLDDPEDKVVALDASSPAPVVAPAVAPTAPAVSPESNAPTQPSAPDPTPTPSLATKRRGQFMDVMHPSSDMKSSPKPVSRHAQTIQPTTDTLPEPPEPAPKDVSQTSETMSFDMESTATADLSDTMDTATVDSQPEETGDTTAMSQWPDPIDMAEQQSVESAPQDPVVEPETDVPADILDEPKETSTSPESVAPLTSPFLPDAKVEKRPLGEPLTGPAPELQSPEETIQPESVETNSNDAETATPVVTLPDELKSDVVALESSTTTVTDAPESATPSVAESEAAPPNDLAVPVGGSILQQYAEQPSTGDQTNGAIFDTSEYHQPVEDMHPAKKSSPLKLIVWIIVLLVVGAVGGAAYFYFTR